MDTAWGWPTAAASVAVDPVGSLSPAPCCAHAFHDDDAADDVVDDDCSPRPPVTQRMPACYSLLYIFRSRTEMELEYYACHRSAREKKER